ncbi:MAG: aminotransferase class V-fold PLP-dependent enzyme [Clostridia bacterium]|nr:aminotransferase class V-fold PLP-dependent enzyme [Clostridia bacterium]
MIYLDNAATSFPKPEKVLRETCEAILSPLGNPGRSGHPFSKKSLDLIFFARETLSRLLGTGSENIVFCSGATCALNIAICGAVEEIRKRGRAPRVATTVFEHNSVLRPLFLLEKKSRIRLKLFSPRRDGTFPYENLMAFQPDILVITLRSNVTGRCFDTQKIASLLSPYNTLIIGDGAQEVGIEDTSFDKTGIHILCAPSHKGLLGIMGAGFLAFSRDLPVKIEPYLTGGTGGDTFNPMMPFYLPERLEAGTLPVPAIYSMAIGAEFVLKTGLGNISRHEKEMKRILLGGIRHLSAYTVYEPNFNLGPLLINHKKIPSEEAATLLSEKGLFLRGGFHCAPLAHQYLGTEESGALRLSPGIFTTKEEIFEALNILESL